MRLRAFAELLCGYCISPLVHVSRDVSSLSLTLLASETRKMTIQRLHTSLVVLVVHGVLPPRDVRPRQVLDRRGRRRVAVLALEGREPF